MNFKARIDSSFRDPSGFVFCENGKYYRQINDIYRETYTQLMENGLYAQLIEKHFLAPHQQLENPSFPEKMGFVLSSLNKLLISATPTSGLFRS